MQLEENKELDLKFRELNSQLGSTGWELWQRMRPAVLLKLTGGWLSDMQEAALSVSAAPRGAIISQRLVKTQEPVSHGHGQWGGGGGGGGVWKNTG